MSAFRHTSPLGSENNSPEVRDGTSALAPATTPGPTGAAASHLSATRRRSSKPATAGKGRIPVLRKGDRGHYVRWLQILLNMHHTRPPLKPDSIFGPKTHDAVVNFQRDSGLDPDGVVGQYTWEKVQIIQAELPHTADPQSAPPQPAAPAASSVPVSEWSLTHRFHDVLTIYTVRHLKPEFRAQFRAMLTPTNISILVGTLVAWGVSHAFGVGEAADVVFAAVGTIFLGLAVFKAGYDIGECVVITVDAKDTSDLEHAGEDLAEAVAILGVAAFFSLLFKVGRWFRGKVRVGKSTGGGGGGGGEGGENEGGGNDSSKDESGSDDEKSDQDEDNKDDQNKQDQPDPAAVRQARLEALAKDPAHGNQISPKSMREAEVGLGCEEDGRIPGPIERDPDPRAEFIDRTGQKWDVKAFNSNFKPKQGGFRLGDAMDDINSELGKQENVIVDTQNMSPEHVQSLQDAVDAQGLNDGVTRVIFY